jgi:hypothetical protein
MSRRGSGDVAPPRVEAREWGGACWGWRPGEGKSGIRVLKNIYRAWEGGPMDGPMGWWVGGTRKHRFGLGLPLIIGSPMLSIVYIYIFIYISYN